jgi:hypothetical protein
LIIALAICTHNRRGLLEQTLRCLASVDVPTGVSLTAILVTNACTDGSGELASRWGGPFALQHVDEPTPGLSHARNRALDVARGLNADVVVWCDDDVIVHADFLHGYVDAFRAFPATTVFGGRILPHFLPPTPDWLPQAIDAVGLHPFSCLDYGAERRFIRTNDLPFGANMAMRLSAVGDRQFDPRLGVTPTRKVGFEETSFLRDVLDGQPWLYVPESSVEHVLPSARQSLRAVAQFYRSIGHYEGWLATQKRVPTITWFGVPRWTLPPLANHTLRAGVRRFLQRDRFGALADEMAVHQLLGYIEAFGREEAPPVRDLIR